MAEPRATDSTERILETATRLFRHHGINAVGVDRIVSEAGVAKMTLYRRFRSKEDLIRAVIERHRQRWTREWLQPRVRELADEPARQLLAIFDAFDEWFHERDFSGCLLTASLLESHDPGGPVGSSSAEALAEVRQWIADVAGQAGAADPERLAQQIHSLMLGAIILAVAGNPDSARAARQTARLLLREELPQD